MNKICQYSQYLNPALQSFACRLRAADEEVCAMPILHREDCAIHCVLWRNS